MAQNDPHYDLDSPLPESLTVTVILKAEPGSTQWAKWHWDAVGVVVGEHKVGGDERDHENAESQLHYFGDLSVRLYKDETESYYHNLMSPKPSCYIVSRVAEDDYDDEVPVPLLVTLSFDQAHSYLEGDDVVFAVPLAPELYRWTEAYVLRHYAPEKKYKRKLKNWKKGEQE